MAEVTFRIPSKAVTYGYVEFPMTFDNNASAEVLASVYVNFVYAFQKEEQAALLAIADPEKPLDVGVPGAAEQRVQGNLKPRTVDEANDMAAAVIKQELGATEVDEETQDSPDAKPWDKAVDSKPKPWETEVTAPAVLDATW